MKRRISLESDFMDWKKDDIMYAYLLNLAEYRKQDNVLWLAKNIYFDCKQEIMDACGYNSPTSLRTNMKKWLDSGLIEEGEVLYGKKNLSAYIFKSYDKNGRYQLVNLEILQKLMDAKNKHSIQIYTYLLSKFTYNPNCYFTLKEIRDLLGYSSSSCEARVNRRITNILQDLQASGYIDYQPDVMWRQTANNDIIRIPINHLSFVAKEVKDLPYSPPVS